MLIGPQNLAENARIVRQRIAMAARAAGRSPSEITLVAVTKGHSLETVRSALDCGLDHIGESYLQEALPKLAAMAHRSDVTWHFIGRLQANKTRAVAEHFAWVHSIDRLKIAERLSAQRPLHAPALNVCLEVSLEAEDSKNGIHALDLPQIAQAVAALPRIHLRGLMCIPPPLTDPRTQLERFTRMRLLLAELRAAGNALDCLSMGMSDDFELAIAAGATHVRIGTALFGPRAAAAGATP
jgi:pyridoxal phosphate enzyme (YggS family)